MFNGIHVLPSARTGKSLNTLATTIACYFIEKMGVRRHTFKYFCYWVIRFVND